MKHGKSKIAVLALLCFLFFWPAYLHAQSYSVTSADLDYFNNTKGSLSSFPDAVENLSDNVRHSVSNIVFDASSQVARAVDFFSAVKEVVFSASKTIKEFVFPPSDEQPSEEEPGSPAGRQPLISEVVSSSPASEQSAVRQAPGDSEIEELKNRLSLFNNELNKIKTSGLIVGPPAPVIETRTVEKIIIAGGENNSNAKIIELSDKLNKQISQLENQMNGRADANFHAIALTNRINNISGATINNSTFTGTVHGLSLDYLSLTGGTLTGSLTGTSAAFSGQLTVSGAATSTIAGDTNFDSGVLYVDSINNRVGIGTTSPQYTLDINGTLRASSIIGAAISTPYAQTIIVAKSGGDYTTITAALNSITDASATKPYVVKVMAGVYNEAVTMKSFVNIEGEGWDSVKITHAVGPTVLANSTTASTSISNLTIETTPSAAAAVNRAVEARDTASLVVYNARITSSSNDRGKGVVTDVSATLRVYNSSIEGIMHGAVVYGGAASALEIQGTNFDNIGANLVRVYTSGKLLLTRNTFGKYNQANLGGFYANGIIIYSGAPTIHSAYNKAKENHLYNVYFRNSANTDGAIMFSTYDSHLTEVTIPSSSGRTGNFIDLTDAWNYPLLILDGQTIQPGTPVYQASFSSGSSSCLGESGAYFIADAANSAKIPATAVMIYNSQSMAESGHCDIGGTAYDFYTGGYFKDEGVMFHPTVFGAQGVKYVANGGGLSATPGNITQRVGTAGFGYSQRFFIEINPGDTFTSVYQNTITVAKSGGDYTTITAALNAITTASSTNRYLIRVMQGEYQEQVTMKQYVDIIGSGWDATKITDTAADSIFVTAASNARLEGMTLERKNFSGPNPTEIININGVSPIIKDVRLIRTTGRTIGIVVNGAASPLIQNIRMENADDYGIRTQYLGAFTGTATIVDSYINAGPGLLSWNSGDSGTFNSYNTVWADFVGGPGGGPWAGAAVWNSYKDSFVDIAGANPQHAPNQKDYDIDSAAMTALTVTQSGTGKIVEFKDGTNPVFTILDGGNIGVSSSTPWAKLSVHGLATDANISKPLFLVASSTASATTTHFIITNTGNVGIGRAAPAYPLDVLGTGTGAIIARFNDVNSTGCTLATGGTISCSSDISLKKNIEDIGDGLNKVLGLHPVLFNWKSEDNPPVGRTSSSSDLKNLGFIAQEVELILPKLVSTENGGIKQLNTIGMIPVLTKAIQELNLKVEGLKTNSYGDSTFIDGISGSFGWVLDQFKNIGVVISDGTIAARKFIADKITTKELCIEDVCVSRNQLKELLEKNSILPPLPPPLLPALDDVDDGETSITKPMTPVENNLPNDNPVAEPDEPAPELKSNPGQQLL